MTDALRTIVTGAASGIGEAVARRLRERGDRVVGIDRQESADGIVADLGSATGRREAVDTALSRLGGLDVLVNVAGVFRTGSVADSGPDDWAPLWEIDLIAPLDLIRLVVPAMTAAGGGRIVNITSVHARGAQRASLAYDVAKAGLEAGTRSAALDLADAGILVNAVAPGFVRTAMSLLDDGRDETDTADFRTRYVDDGRLPLRRGATADEIAPAVAFLTARDTTYITGQVLTVDGGLTMTF